MGMFCERLHESSKSFPLLDLDNKHHYLMGAKSRLVKRKAISSKYVSIPIIIFVCYVME